MDQVCPRSFFAYEGLAININDPEGSPINRFRFALCGWWCTGWVFFPQSRNLDWVRRLFRCLTYRIVGAKVGQLGRYLRDGWCCRPSMSKWFLSYRDRCIGLSLSLGRLCDTNRIYVITIHCCLISALFSTSLWSLFLHHPQTCQLSLIQSEAQAITQAKIRPQIVKIVAQFWPALCIICYHWTKNFEKIAPFLNWKSSKVNFVVIFFIHDIR